MAQVELTSIAKSFDAAPVLSDIDLKVGDGEFLTLVGPSGCGKSTLIRIIAGLEPQTSGSVSIGGAPIDHLRPHERRVAMVFQSYALYPYLTVAQNIGFPLKMARVKRDERDRRVREVADLLGLTELLERKPGQLSGGQRQRVAMGRAIVREPHVFLMDEPLSNLDAKLRVQTRSQIAALQQRLGTTTVYVTHDQVEAMTMGHRVAVLLDGVLQQVDTPRALYDRPANVFVAGFIGSPAMNIKTVPLTDDGGRFGEVTIPLTRDQITAARNGDGANGAVQVGFRPEDTDLVGESDGGVPIKVDLVEELGSDAYVYGHADFDGADERFVVRTDGRDAPQMGETVHIKPRSGHHHVFHAASGDRID